MGIMGLFCVIPATMILAVSFFVLVVAGKTEDGRLKTFGKAIAVILWVCSALVLSAGIYIISTGGCCCPQMHRGMMMRGGKCMEMNMEKRDMMKGECHAGKDMDEMKRQMPKTK